MQLFTRISASRLIVPAQILMAGAYIVQKDILSSEISHQDTFVQTGLQSLQTNLGVLQATIALIELSNKSSIVLEAVNLQQTLKLKKEVEQMRIEIKSGFIDLQQAFNTQKSEVRQIINKVVNNINFAHHHAVLSRAYGLFIQAVNRLRSALKLPNGIHRYAEIDSAREILFEALGEYIAPQSMETISAPGQIRRFECAWIIEQAIIISYQIQNEALAVSEHLFHFRDKMKEQIYTVINNCESYDELNFIFPEISRICKHDLAVLEVWQDRLDWVRSLPAMEMEFLLKNDSKISANYDFLDRNKNAKFLFVPPEQLLYEDLAEKSHFYSLLDQLIFMVKPALRQEYEVYINQQAHATGHKMLGQKNLQQASDMTIANLYYYFKVRDESNTEEALALL